MVVDDRSGRVLEAWTGFRVAWPMARGLPGQFGQAANAPWVWIALCGLFALPFLRPPWRMLHVDLAVLLAFSVSYAFFGAGDVEVSVPTALPPLLWLLGRLLWVAWHRPRAPVRLLLPAGALLWLLAFLVAFRVALNLFNGNVIDVGYAGVVGADRLLGARRCGAPSRPTSRAGTRTARRSTSPTRRSSWCGRGGGLGRPAGGPRRVGGLRPRLPGRAVAGGAAARRPAAGPAARVPVGGLSVHAGRVELGEQRRPRRRRRARRAAPARPARGARRGPRRGRPDQVRAAGARAAVRRVRPQPTGGGADHARGRRGGRRPARPRREPPGRARAVLGADAGVPGRPREPLLALGAVRRPRVAAGARRPRGAGARPRRRAGARAGATCGRGRAGRGRARRGPARARPLVLPLPRVVPAARPDRACAAATLQAGGRAQQRLDRPARRRPRSG